MGGVSRHEMPEDVWSAIYALIEQVEMSDYRDENDHALKMNGAYLDLVALTIGQSCFTGRNAAQQPNPSMFCAKPKASLGDRNGDAA